MKASVCVVLLCLFYICECQNFNNDIEDRKHHKKKRRPYQGGYGGYGGYGSPCVGRESQQESRTLIAALGGAAVGYTLGNKLQKPGVINNNIYNQVPGGGAPCGPVQNDLAFFPQAPYGGGGGGHGGQGGLLGSHPVLANHLGSHLGGNGASGALAGLAGLAGLGGQRQGVNWDRMIRQFERHVVRPIIRYF